MGEQSTQVIDHLRTDSVTLSRLIAGDGFEPPFSRVWTLWDSASLSCDVHVWKNHFSTFTYWLLEEVTIPPINSTIRNSVIHSYALPCAFPTTKLSVSKQAERPESNRNPWSDPASLPLTYIPHNPDFRVSKVFIVLCLPLSDFHGDVVSFIRRCYQSFKLTNEYVGNCTRFSTSRFRSNLFLLRTYSQKKGGRKMKKKAKTSNQQALQGSPCLARL